MKRARLLELADRVEAATGPDIYLDADIRDALGLPHDYAAEWRGWGFGEDGKPIERPKAFPYTASLDAALSLVPEGLVKNLGDDTGAAWAHVWKDEPAYDGMPFGARAVTLSLALTAACLRTLANQDDSK